MSFDEAKTSLKMTLRGLHGRLQSLCHRNITHHSKSLKIILKIYKIILKIYTSNYTVAGVAYNCFA